MVARFHYDNAVFRRLASDQLPADEEKEVTAHVEQCPACQSKLESIAEAGIRWDDVRLLLDSRAVEASGAASSTGQRDQTAPSGDERTIDFLAPSDNPKSLGRFGRYEITEILGHGGMGVVMRGYDPALDRHSAIKVLAPELATNASARNRFSREAKSAAAVVHEHVVPVQTVDEERGLPYLVMPVVEGQSLEQRVAENGPLAVVEILRIGMQTASGLAAAHAQGLVHRDIKPANILLENGVERVMITDFGLARAADDANMTRSGVVAGTPQYMSPEQARGEDVDHRSDLFSLGSVLYFTCTGRSPFRAETTMGVLNRITNDTPRSIRKINPDVPEWLQGIIMRLLEKDPDDRFESAGEVAELLEACIAHVQQPAAAPLPASLATQSSGGRFFSIPHRSAMVVTIAAAFGVSLLGMISWRATTPPDISGRWAGEDWGQVALEQKRPGKYVGTYTRTAGETPGSIQVKWSRIERRYNGTWREGKDRFGEISLRLVDDEIDDEIRGAWTTGKGSRVISGIPVLGDLVWKRSGLRIADLALGPAPFVSPSEPQEMDVGALRKASDMHRLQGFWKIVQEQGPDKTTDEADSVGWLIISDDRLVRGRAGGMPFELKFELVHPQTRLKKINLFQADAPKDELRGIYSLEGDTLRLCVAPDGTLDRPTQFAAGGESRATLLTLKRLPAIVLSAGKATRPFELNDEPGLKSAIIGDPAVADFTPIDGKTLSEARQFQIKGKKAGYTILTIVDQDDKKAQFGLMVKDTLSSEMRGLGTKGDAPVPELTLSEVVDAFLEQDRQLKSLETGYSVIQRDVRNGTAVVLEKGIFEIRGTILAARNAFSNAVYDGKSTQYTLGGEQLEVPRAGSLFAQHWSTPVLAFHRMQDTELTPMATVLRDAAGPKAFGTAELLPQHLEVKGDPCYVIEGEYDRVKLNGLARPAPIPWRYRIYLNPRFGMRMVKMDTFDVGQNIPLGTVVVEALEQYGDAWIPIHIVFKSYAYATRETATGDEPSLDSEHVYDNVIELDRSTIRVDQERSVIPNRAAGAAMEGRTDSLPALESSEALEAASADRTTAASVGHTRSSPKYYSRRAPQGSVTAETQPAVLLSDAVYRFNQQQRQDAIGRDQPPLTDAEVIASIRAEGLAAAQEQLSKEACDELVSITESRLVPARWRLEKQTRVTSEEGGVFTIWAVNLRLVRGDGTGFTHVIRDRTLEYEPPSGQVEVDKHQPAADWIPLADVVAEFNEGMKAAKSAQPPLTSEEFIASLRRFLSRDHDRIDFPPAAIDAVTAMADTGTLPRAAVLDQSGGFSREAFDFQCQNIRLEFPSRTGRHALMLRRRYLDSSPKERIDDDDVAWGPKTADGLQVGVHVARGGKSPIPGEEFRTKFFFRNQTSTSIVRLEGLIAFEIDARTPTGDKLEVTESHDIVSYGTWPFPTELKGSSVRAERYGYAFLVGAMSKEDFDASGVKLAPVSDQQYPIAVVHADPGQRIRLRFRVPNYSDPKSAQLITGPIDLTVRGPSTSIDGAAEDREQAAIRAELLSLGAYSVGFGEDSSIIRAAFHDPVASPEIARFKRFAVLDFKEAHITSESLNNLAGLEHVGVMLLTLCDVQDEDLSPLTKIGGIRILSLSHTEITDSAVDTIAAIPGLEWVDVSDTRVTQRGIARLRAARPSVKIEPLFGRSTPLSRQKG